MNRKNTKLIVEGEKFHLNGHAVKVLHVLDMSSVVVELSDTLDRKLVHPKDLADISVEEASPAAPDISRMQEEQWEKAKLRLEIIRPLLNMKDRTAEDIEKRAAEFGTSAPSIYRWIDRYRAHNSINGLFDNVAGMRAPRAKRVHPEVEEIIRKIIEQKYLTNQKIKNSVIIRDVRKACIAAGHKPPANNTIRARTRRRPEIEKARSRGDKRKVESLTATPGTNPQGDYLLSDVQIDHTPLPIVIVDEEHREPIRRPYATVLIDKMTRMVMGFYLSLDPPSTMSVALAIVHAMFPKDEWLAQRGIEGEWAVWGCPGTIHADNAKEFREEALQRGALAHGFDIQWRPVKKPHYGAHIERFLGTSGTKLMELPGTLFSGPTERGDYDSNDNACMTFRELEAAFAHWVVNIYHKTPHSGLGGLLPEQAHSDAILGDGKKSVGRGLPAVPQNQKRTLIDFLPIERRVVNSSGIQIRNVRFYDKALNPWVGVTNPDPHEGGKFIIRYDMRSASPIYFWDPKLGDYQEIPFADLTRPNVSFWDIDAAIKRLKERGVNAYDEGEIFRQVDKLDAMVDAAKVKTSAARRAKQQRVERNRSRNEMEANSSGHSSTKPVSAENDDEVDLCPDPVDFEEIDFGDE